MVRPSLEGGSAANAIGAEKIGRTMKRSFCEGAIAGKGIVKAILTMRGDRSATTTWQTRSGQSRSAEQ